MRAEPRPRIDVDAAPDEAFAITEDLPPFESAWHSHNKHQVVFAATGTAILTVKEARWILPPQRAAWIRANTPHRVTSTTGIALRTIYIATSLVSLTPESCGVFSVTPLAREMMLFAARWGPRDTIVDSENESTRSAFFAAFAGLCIEWLTGDPDLVLPRAATPDLDRAMAYVEAHLADATVEQAAAAAHVSVRTLARRFEDEARMTFRAYLQTARFVRALELLAVPGASVTVTAYAVGFRSPGAFASAFSERCGETPSSFHARTTGRANRKRTKLNR